jgi:hypothetical protein
MDVAYIQSLREKDEKEKVAESPFSGEEIIYARPLSKELFDALFLNDNVRSQ